MRRVILRFPVASSMTVREPGSLNRYGTGERAVQGGSGAREAKGETRCCHLMSEQAQVTIRWHIQHESLPFLVHRLNNRQARLLVGSQLHLRIDHASKVVLDNADDMTSNW